MIRSGAKLWIIVGLVVLVVASFLFSAGLRNTVSRRRSVHRLKTEIDALSKEIEKVRSDIAMLKTNPQAYEILIRHELGYLRPGEKEIRFADLKK